jgi:hypothetical protein
MMCLPLLLKVSLVDCLLTYQLWYCEAAVKCRSKQQV